MLLRFLQLLLTQKGKNQLLMTMQIFPSLLIQSQGNKTMITLRKFLNLWATKLPWAKMCLGSNGLLQNVKCKIYSQVEEKTSSLLLSGTHFAST